MFLATLVIACALPQAAMPKAISADSPATAVETAKNASAPAASLPERPEPKIVKDDALLSAKLNDGANADAAPAAGAAIQPGRAATPIKPVYSREYENRRQKKIWYGLMAVSHGAAAFDAWSTRRAVAGGYGTEANPFLRGASHSNMIYVATQVSPAVMDFLGRKMMTSRNGFVRKMWWLPQTAGTGFSISAGVHRKIPRSTKPRQRSGWACP